MREILGLALSPKDNRSNWGHTLNEFNPQCLNAHAHTAEALPAALRRERNGRACVFVSGAFPPPPFRAKEEVRAGKGCARPKCRKQGKDGGRAHAGRLQSESAMLYVLCKNANGWRASRGGPPSLTDPEVPKQPWPHALPPAHPDPSPQRAPHASPSRNPSTHRPTHHGSYGLEGEGERSRHRVPVTVPDS